MAAPYSGCQLTHIAWTLTPTFTVRPLEHPQTLVRAEAITRASLATLVSPLSKFVNAIITLSAQIGNRTNASAAGGIALPNSAATWLRIFAAVAEAEYTRMHQTLARTVRGPCPPIAYPTGQSFLFFSKVCSRHSSLRALCEAWHSIYEPR